MHHLISVTWKGSKKNTWQPVKLMAQCKGLAHESSASASADGVKVVILDLPETQQHSMLLELA